jgi:hypothetical protein
MKLQNRPNQKQQKFSFIKKKNSQIRIDENMSEISDMETIISTRREEAKVDQKKLNSFLFPKGNKENFSQN